MCDEKQAWRKIEHDMKREGGYAERGRRSEQREINTDKVEQEMKRKGSDSNRETHVTKRKDRRVDNSRVASVSCLCAQQLQLILTFHSFDSTLNVRLVSSSDGVAWSRRTFQIEYNTEKRIVSLQQTHFSGWRPEKPYSNGDMQGKKERAIYKPQRTRSVYVVSLPCHSPTVLPAPVP